MRKMGGGRDWEDEGKGHRGFGLAPSAQKGRERGDIGREGERMNSQNYLHSIGSNSLTAWRKISTASSMVHCIRPPDAFL